MDSIFGYQMIKKPYRHLFNKDDSIASKIGIDLNGLKGSSMFQIELSIL